MQIYQDIFHNSHDDTIITINNQIRATRSLIFVVPKKHNFAANPRYLHLLVLFLENIFYLCMRQCHI